MGFLDRVRASFAQASGGRATLTLTLDPAHAQPGDTVAYHLVLTTTGPLNADGITIGLYGREQIRGGASGDLPSAVPAGWDGAEPMRELLTHQQSGPVASGALSLAAGASQAFHGTLRVPADSQPTYRGLAAQHLWRVRAVVVMPLGDEVSAEAELLVR